MSSDEITNPRVRRLAVLSEMLAAEEPEEIGEWDASPFGWLRRLPSRSMGARGERLVSAWCESLGYSVRPTGDSEADRMIEGRRVEIKLSTRWSDGRFVFQQIRDQRYDFMICVGLHPFDAAIWIIPKDVLMSEPEGVRPQHAGRAGRDTWWLNVSATEPYAWMHEWGGSLARAETVLARIFGASQS